jgi:hypothetical protein
MKFEINKKKFIFIIILIFFFITVYNILKLWSYEIPFIDDFTKSLPSIVDSNISTDELLNIKTPGPIKESLENNIKTSIDEKNKILNEMNNINYQLMDIYKDGKSNKEEILSKIKLMNDKYEKINKLPPTMFLNTTNSNYKKIIDDSNDTINDMRSYIASLLLV